MLFATGTIAASGVILGTPSAAQVALPLGERLFQTELFFDILAAIFYVVVAIEEERRDALRAISSQIGRLENVLGEMEGESKAKTDFLAVLAHELRNPLAPVVSSIELLRVRNWVDKEGQPVLDVMEGSLKVVKRLLDDILDISRITQKKLTLQKEPFHVGTVVRRAVSVLQKRVEEKHQVINVALPSVPLIIEADPVRLEQVVTNLLVNASKFTPEGGTISVVARDIADFAEIRITDSGIGIEPEMLGRIFEPFVQIDEGHRGREGLGIGLALSKRLIEEHGGSVEAYSKGKGRGSEFIVRIPLAFATRLRPSDMQNERSHGEAQTRARRILVVDDNVAAARAVGALLEYDGHTVDYAMSGTEAKEKTRLFKPDTEILDIGLPDINGYDLAKHLRDENGYRGLLIALTGYGQDEDKERAKQSGFDIHLTKPVGMKDLRAALVT
jgi:signal transduction histidine kinase